MDTGLTLNNSIPAARVLIIGGSGVSYGAAPPPGTTWRDIFLNEVKDKLDFVTRGSGFPSYTLGYISVFLVQWNEKVYCG